MNRREFYLKCIEMGRCIHHPDKDVVFGKTKCLECLNYCKNYEKVRRQTANENGLCTTCYKSLQKVGYKTCDECLKLYIEKKKKRMSIWKCLKHPNEDIVFGKSCCQKCLDYGKEHQEQRRIIARGKGLCDTCCIKVKKKLDILHVKIV